jgi:hypothetical protein
VKKYGGESASIQRCQVHKRRNVLDNLADDQKASVAKRLNAAYALEEYAGAKQALNQLHRELMDSIRARHGLWGRGSPKPANRHPYPIAPRRSAPTTSRRPIGTLGAS